MYKIKCEICNREFVSSYKHAKVCCSVCRREKKHLKYLAKKGEKKDLEKSIVLREEQLKLEEKKAINSLKDMDKVGVYFGKFLPPHRGHLSTILKAATKVQKLYVVVSDDVNRTKAICAESNIKEMPVNLRIQWLCQELIDMPHIKVIKLDETDIPAYPNGWNQWADKMRECVGEKIDMFFCGEEEYVSELLVRFEGVRVTLMDPERTMYNISATKIRSNPYKYWNYILGPARPFFAKKILIAGTESSGKTTLTKSLAKLYHTSWSEEVGRYYAENFLGGNETIFTDEDFSRIAHQQTEQDYAALRNANKLCFFDTDATITQYYSLLYMGHRNDSVEACVNPDRYDKVFLLKPDVEWVSDGQRLNGDQSKREELHQRLKYMYIERGFGDKLIEVGGNYSDRLETIISEIEVMING